MRHSLLGTPLLLFMMFVSFFGLFVIWFLVFNPPAMKETHLWRKPIIGSIFASICVMGIVAVLLPKQCSAVLHSRSRKRDTDVVLDPDVEKISPNFRGHHPDCVDFSGHVIMIGNRRFCAACTGLLLGGLLALVGAGLYFLGNWRFEQNVSLVVLLGTVGIGLGLFQLLFRGYIRLVLNFLFVFGAFLVLVGVDQMTQSIFLDLFLLILMVFWLLTRILLSQWDHWRICRNCRLPCEFHANPG